MNHYSDLHSGSGRRTGRFAWRVLSLVMALSILLNSVSFAKPKGWYTISEIVGADHVDFGIGELETELSDENDWDDAYENVLMYGFGGEKSVLLSQIFAMYLVPYSLRDVESVLMPGGDGRVEPTDSLFVESLTDENQAVYDYKITALRYFDEARLSVTLYDGTVYMLLLNNFTAELSDADLPEAYDDDMSAEKPDDDAELTDALEDDYGENDGEGEDFADETSSEPEETAMPVDEIVGEGTGELTTGEIDEIEAENDKTDAPSDAENGPEEPEKQTEVDNDENATEKEQTGVDYDENENKTDEMSAEEGSDTTGEPDEEVMIEGAGDEAGQETVAELTEDLDDASESQSDEVQAETLDDIEPSRITLDSGTPFHETERLLLSLTGSEGAAAALRGVDIETPDYMSVEEAYTVEPGEGCEGVEAVLLRSPALGEGEYLALYGLIDGTLSEVPLSEGFDEGSAVVIDTARWDGFALVRLGLTAYQQLPAGSVGESTVALSGTLPVSASVSMEALDDLEQSEDVVAACDISVTDAADNTFEPLEGMPVEITVRSEAIRLANEAGSALAVAQMDAASGTEESVEILSVEGDAVTFATESFDAFVVREIVLEKTRTDSDERTYRITVNYDSASGVPEDAALAVNEIVEGDDRYAAYVERSVERLGAADSAAVFARAFDIALVNSETGEEYHPEKGVQVSIRLLDEALDGYDSLEVVHFHGENENQLDIMDSTVNGEAVEFLANGFSVYVLIASEGSQTEYDSLEALIAAAQDGDTIALNEDAVGHFSTDKNLTIDLNGHTLTVDAAEGVQSTGGALTIINGAITSSFDDIISANGGSVTLGDGLSVDCSSSVIYAYNGGSVIVDGADVTSTSTKYSAAFATGSGSSIEVRSGSLSKTGSNDVTLSVKNGATAEISGGTVTNDASSTVHASGEGSVVTISGGTVSNDTEQPFCAVYSSAKGTIEVTGGEITAANNYALVAASQGRLNVSGGVITGGEGYRAILVHENDASQAEISGGTIGGLYAKQGTTLISGGTFTEEVSAASEDNLTITRGVFQKGDVSAYVDEDSESTVDESGYIHVDEAPDVFGAVTLAPESLALYPNDLGRIAVSSLPEGYYFKWVYAPGSVLGSGGWDTATGEGRPYGKAPGTGTATLTFYSDSARTQAVYSLEADVTVADVAARVNGREYAIADFNDAVAAAIESGATLEVYTSSNRITLGEGQSLQVAAADNRGKGSVIVSAPEATAEGAYVIEKTTDAETGITTYTCEKTEVLVEFTPADGGAPTYATSLSIGSKAGTYKLLGDIPDNNRVTVTGTDITLDLNGHSIGFASGSTYPAIMIGSNAKTGSLTITDTSAEGAGRITNTGDIAIWAAYRSSAVVIEGGEIEAALSAVYTSNGSTAEINGGTFRATGGDASFLINCKDDNKNTITVNYGTFYGFNPEDNAADGAQTNYVTAENKIVVEEPEGVFAVEDENNVTVTFDEEDDTYPIVQELRSGDMATAPETVPVKDGYTFGGWGTVDGEGTWTEFRFDTPVNENIVLKAKWLKNVTITAASAEWEYNGTTRTENGFAVTGLEAGDDHSFAVVMTESSVITDVGTKANVIATVDGVEVTVGVAAAVGDYMVTTEDGTLTVNPKAVTVTAVDLSKTYGGDDPEFTAIASDEDADITYNITRAEGEDVGTYAITPSGDAAQGNYAVTYEPGTFTIKPIELTITAATDEKVYDGTPLTKDGYTADTELGTGDSFDSVTVTGSQTEAGSSDNVPSAAKIVNADGEDVTRNYAISYTNGTLTVTQRTLTITAEDAEKVYDGTPLSKDAYSSEGLAVGDVIDSVTVTGSWTVVGESDNVPSEAKIVNADGEDVTDSYKITYANGTLKVTKKPLTITADSDEKVYDGTALTKDSYTNTELAGGDVIDSVTVTGSRTVVGESDNVPSEAKIINADEADVTDNYEITYTEGTLKVTKKPLTITADSDEKVYDGTALTKDGYTNTELAKGDSIESVTVTGSRTVVGESDNVPSEAKIVNADEADVTDNYEITYTEGTLKVTKKPLTITADSDEKVYDGTALTKDSYTNTELAKGDSIDSVTVTGSQTAAGESANVASGAKIINADEADVTDNYEITYTDGTLTVTPAPVILTAVSGIVNYNGQAQSLSGFTPSVEGLSFIGVSASAAGTEVGTYDVDFDGVTLGETTDTTGNYVVMQTIPGTFRITVLLKKEIVSISGNRVNYRVTVNADAITVNGGEPLTLTDTLRNNEEDITNQTIDYSSIRIEPAGTEVAYDFSSYTGSFVVPDGTALTISYTTRVLGSSGEECTFGNDAALTDSDGTDIAEASITEKQTIYPTASDVSGTDVYMVKLYVYGDAHMEKGLAEARFMLLDENRRPMTHKKGDNAGENVIFTTDENGYADIQSDDFDIEKNTVYYLDMIQAPTGYKRDIGLYSFMITDDAAYDAGDIYTYFNGDTMKVRLYPEASSLDVGLRLSGNYALTEEQREGIEVVLQRLNEAGEWEEIERHSYAEFTRGMLTFDAGTDPAFEVGETYRVIEENARPWSLSSTIKLNTTYSLSSGSAAAKETTVPQEFTVTEENVGGSFSVVITNEYEEPKLTLTKMDKKSGTKLSGAVFTVRKVLGEEEIKRYTSDANGEIEISGGEDFESETLYYIVETQAPAGYLLSLEPEKLYFYFCNDEYLKPFIEADLPEGETAVNLSEKYDSRTVDNQKENVTVPVIKTWQGNTWPNHVDYVVVGLYQSVNGSEPEKVFNDEGEAMTVELSASAPYNNKAFANLPMRDEHGDPITYSVKEEIVQGTNQENIISEYVQEYGVSDTGIYVVRNKLAATLTVDKEWYGLDGEKITDTDELAQQPDVIFDIYRTIETIPEDVREDGITNAEMTDFVSGLELVRSGLTFGSGDGWTVSVSDLDRFDDALNPYHYYVMETVPSFGDESYVVDEENGIVTIQNKVAPEVKTLTVSKAQLVDDPRPEAVETDFSFTLRLNKGDHAIRRYQVAEDLVTDWDGEVTFTLKPETSIALSVPEGVTVTVSEAENPEYTVKVNDVDDREYSYTVAEDTTLTFTNTLHVICKVYDGDAEVPFESLKSALKYIRTHEDTYHGTAAIYMLEDYVIPTTDIFDVAEGENITLTTALTAEEDPTTEFPFRTDRTENTDVAVITRGGVGDSMLSNAGTLTLEKITLDGAKDSCVVECDGGLVNSTGTLNLTEKTTLRNSATTGKGGAIFAAGTVNMPGGSITGNAASSASAIYLDGGTLNMTGGSIEDNSGAEDGAIVVSDTECRINLSGSPVIFNNYNAGNAWADIYLGVDSDNVINVVDPGLNADALIGVRAMETHREIGEQFATAEYGITDNLNRFVNDEYEYRGRLKDGTATNVVWDGLTLTLKKVFDGPGANASDTFTITLSSTSIRKNSYTVDGNLDNTITAARMNTPGSIVLRNVHAGDEIAISPLPVGSYTVTEADSNYAPTYAGVNEESQKAFAIEDGAFNLQGNSVITVTNTRRLAQISLTKTLQDKLKASDETQAFPFTIELTDADGTQVSGFELAAGVVTGSDGAAALTMSPSNAEADVRSFIAPVGATMTITETANPDYRITASAVAMPAEGDGAAIEDEDTGSNHIFAFAVTDDGADVTFDNERKISDIVLTKVIEDKVSVDEAVTLTVTLTRRDGEPAANYTMYADADDPTKNIATDESGRAVIPFVFPKNESQQSVTLTLPEGTKLEVEEDEVTKDVDGTQQAIYDTTYSVNGAEAVTGLKATIQAFTETDRSIVFTNTRKMRTVTVTNTVNGYAGNAQSFEYTASVSDGGEKENDYNSYGFTDNAMTFVLVTDQSQTLTVPYGAELTIKQTFVVGYETTVQHGSAAATITDVDAFTVAEDVTVAFTNTQLINIVLENKTTADITGITVTVGYGTKMYRVNDAQDGQAPEESFNSATRTARIDVGAGKTAILEVDHPFDSGNTSTQDYTVSGTTPEDGYYYTITNAASYHEYGDPYITRIYNSASFTVKGKLRFSNADTTITVAAQPLVSFDADGGVWTNEMEGYHDRDGDKQVYQYAVDAGDRVPVPTPPVYPTAEGIEFLGWKQDVSSDEYFDFSTPITGPVTLYAVWTRPERDTRVVTVKNETGATITVTASEGVSDSFELSNGATKNLSVADGARLVLTASGVSCGAYSTVFTDADTVNESYTIAAVNRDGTVVFIGGICKITDAEGKLLYKGDNIPAVYMTLEEAFTDYNNVTFNNGTPAAVKMLIDEYAISKKHPFPTKDVILTTAGKDDAEFPYVGTRDRATLYRAAGYISDTLFTHEKSATSVTLTDIILDGRNVKLDKFNGGLIYMKYDGAELNVETGTVMRNVEYSVYSDSSKCRGGAIYIQGGTMNVKAGLFSNLYGRRGGAICADTSAVLNITGSNGGIQFVDCVATSNSTSQDGFGGAIYHEGTGSISVNGGSDLDKPGVIFTRCVGNRGGGIYTPYTGAVNISGCRFEECRTVYETGDGVGPRRIGGGGISITNAERFTVAYCSFFRCDTMGSGAGIVGVTQDKYDAIDAEEKKPDAIIDHCVFESCNSRSQGGGSAVYPATEGGSARTNLLLISNCTYTDCSVGTMNSSAGAMQTYMPYFDLVNTDVTNCWAGKEGGAINQWTSPVQEARLTVTDCTFTDCRSEARYQPGESTAHHGGAISTCAYTVKISGSTFDNCVSPTQHGGAVATIYGNNTGNSRYSGTKAGSSTTIEDTIFKNCSAKTNGGALSVFTHVLTMKNTQFIDCISYNRGGAVSIEKYFDGCEANIENCTFTGCSSGDGGAIYTQSDNTTFAGCTVSDCAATRDGGAIYAQRKNITFAGCTISDCVATGNGGGIFLKNTGAVQATISAVTTENGTVGSITNCQANKGSAVYAEFKTFFSGVSITDNTVVDKESGAVHGWNLQFEGDTVVQNNDCSNDSLYDHDVLYFDNNNTRINTTATGLGEHANIGVYVTDAQLNGHGLEGKPFGTWNNNNWLDSFFNDRNDELFGYGTDTDKLIYWGPYLCKITDEEGNTLKRTNGRDAIYQRLSLAIGDFKNVLDENGETGKSVYIKMLVEDYTLQQTTQIENFPEDADITLTTAGRNEPDNKHPYRGAEGTVCTISRTNSTNQLFKLTKASTTFRFTNITLDGRSDKTSDVGTGYRLMEATAGKVIVDGGTTLQYGKSGDGGAFRIANPAEIIINSRLGNDVLFDHCTGTNNGGAIYSTGNLTITREVGADGSASTTTFSNCTAKLSGAVCVEGSATFANVDGAVFENCSAVNSVGGAFHFRRNANDAKVVIKNSRFDNCYTTHTTETDGGNLQGGAINCWAGTLEVENCAFTNCFARGDGGAIYHVNNNKIKTELVNCTFDNCGQTGTTNRNGGAVYTQAKQVIITNCAFANCEAINSAGALHCQNGEEGSSVTISGCDFENCAANGATSYGGAIFSRSEIMTVQNYEGSKATTIKNCVANGYSGAIYKDLRDGSKATTLNISDDTLISGCYANQGGAIYLRSSVTLNLTGSPEFTKNGYTSDGRNASQGACIYLVEGSKINLKDSPKFSRNNITNVDRVINGGNTDYVRQDIYLAGYSGKDAASIYVTGDLTGDTIWVWPEQDRHKFPNNQFAMTEAGVSDASLQKFRNALADAVTGCSNGEYLAGVRLPASDKTGTKVYWSKMYNISFKKIDNKAVAVPGAEFTLFVDAACTVASVKAVSADGENDTNALGEILAKGYVDFPSVPIGVYYMKETKVPESFKPNDTTYLVLVGTPSLAPTDNNKEYWEGDGPLAVANAADLVAKHTTNAGKYFGIFPLKDGKADLSKNLASTNVGLTNVRNDYEAWFLKADSSDLALPGAAFTIFEQIGNETYDNGYPKLTLWSRDGETYPEPVMSASGTDEYKKLDGTTVPKGVVYFRELPIGTYYLAESTYPERNGNNRRTFFVEDDRVFKLEVRGEAGFTLSQWQTDGSYVELEKQGDDYIVRDIEAVCKLTDADDNLLYHLGSDGETRLPAIYATLEEGFAAAQAGVLVDAAGHVVADDGIDPDLKLKVLRDFTISQPIVIDTAARALTFTTAERTVAKDKYIFTTTRTTDTARAEIKRAYDGETLITVRSGASLTLQNINLNGADHTGRALHVREGSLTVLDSTKLQNFTETANGAAVLLESGTTLTVDGGSSRTAEFNDNKAANGGAIAGDMSCRIGIINAQFTGNSATNGGAIDLAATEGTPQSMTLENAVFTGNTAAENGGAIRAGAGSDLTLKNDTFTGNSAVNGGAVYTEGGLSVQTGSALRSNTATEKGGAIYAASGASVSIEGNARLQTNSATANGGAVYAAFGSVVTLTGGTISGNSADTDGAGFYLAEGSTMNLSGNPAFSGNNRTGTLEDATNGGEAYTRARQDIYIEESPDDPASLVVTGDVTSAKGSIWVWAEHANHYEAFKPFAIAGTTLSDSTYLVFRDAQTDELTLCGSDTYLTGDKGDNPSFIYWTGTAVLSISKTVISDLQKDAATEFSFTVTLTGSTLGGATGKQYGDLTFKNGKAEVKLKPGETQRAIFLPVGAEYTVTETPNADFDTTSAYAVGTLSKTPSEAVFTNTRKTGELTVSKAVTSDLAEDKVAPFTFTVTLTGLTETAKNKTYSDVEFTDGVATLTLKDGESKKISGLPTGVSYAVTETENSSFTTTQEGDTGTISATPSTAAFRNTRKTGDLKVSKTVIGSTPEDQAAEFDFTVTLDNAGINGAYGDLTFENGVTTFKLKGGASVEIKGLPVGIRYAVIETEDENYTTTQTGDTGTFSTTPCKAEFTNKRKQITTEVILTAASDSKTYDGTPLTNHSYDIDGLPEGFTLTATVTGSQTKAGTGKNVITDYVITNTAGEDVTALFINVTKVEGTLTVTKKAVTITADSDQKVYDGTALTKNGYTNSALATGDSIASVTVTGTQTVVGTSDNEPSGAKIVNAAGEDVTGSYEITYVNGTLEVTKKAVTITADSAEKVYDGTALTKNGYTNSALATGDSIDSVTITGSQTVVGTSDNEPSGAKIVNAAGDDVTGSYEITYVNGTLKVTKKAVTITADSAEKVYDGTALTKDSYTNSALAIGDSIESVTITGSQTVVGTSDNVPSAAKIVNAAGEDVTGSYEITYVNGTLKVTKKTVTITADSAEKVYDGTALTKDSYTNTELAEGDSIDSVTVTGSQTVVGTSDNVPSEAKIVNADGEDVTESYEITYDNGTLTVYPKVTIKKVLEDTFAGENEEFDFTLTVSTQDGTPVKEWVLKGEPGADAVETDATKGEATIALKDGDTIDLTLPLDAKLKIQEGEHPYVTEITENVDGVNGSPVRTNEWSIDLSNAQNHVTITYTNIRPLCKITLDNGSEVAFITLNEAMAFVRDEFSDHKATIEMLMDYTMPKDDILTIPEGYDITLTTAAISGGFYNSMVALATIARDEDDSDYTDDDRMVTVNGKLTLAKLTLDGNNGGIVSASGNTAMLTIAENATLTDGNSDKGSAVYVADGGAVNMTGGSISENTNAVYVAKDGSMTISSGEIKANGVSAAGGAVYVADGGTVEFTGGTISDNSCAGIYLTEDAKLKLSGNPVFSNNNTALGTEMKEAENGGDKVYEEGKARQDIYLAGNKEKSEAIVLTGNLDEGYKNGSIWVWAEAEAHYYLQKQFAVLDSGFTDEVKEDTYKAFRNAQPDDLTDCVGDYLTGQVGKGPSLYWTGGFDVTFKKIDGFGEPLGGASFTLFKDADCTTLLENVTTSLTAASNDGSSDAAQKGVVLFKDVPTGFWYMQEKKEGDTAGTYVSGAPQDYAENAITYIVLAGKKSISSFTDPIWAADGVLSNIKEEDVKAQTGTDSNAKLFAIFAIDPVTGKAVTTPDIAANGILNASEASRKVVLRKIDGDTDAPIAGAKFEILRYDGSPVSGTDINGNTVTTFESGSSGVYFIGTLPYGTYYLHETTVTDGYKRLEGTNDNWFILTVNESGVGYEKENGTKSFGNILNPEASKPD